MKTPETRSRVSWTIPLDLEGAPWTSTKDRPLFSLSPRRILATDDELQWVVYERRGKSWRAVAFPTIKETLVRYTSGDTLAARKVVQEFPDRFRWWCPASGPAVVLVDA